MHVKGPAARYGPLARSGVPAGQAVGMCKCRCSIKRQATHRPQTTGWRSLSAAGNSMDAHTHELAFTMRTSGFSPLVVAHF